MAGTRAVVQEKLLEQIDEGLCGPEGYRIDAPYCNTEDRESVNLSAYSKVDSLIRPFSDPVQVAFCHDFKRWYYGFADEKTGDSPSKSCSVDESECLGASRKTLARIASDCAQIEEEHKVVEGWHNKAFGALGLAGAWLLKKAIWAFKNSEKARGFFRAVFSSTDEFGRAKPRGLRGFIDWLFGSVTRATAAAKGERTPEQIELESKANEIAGQKWPIIADVAKSLSADLGVDHSVLVGSANGTASELVAHLTKPQTIAEFQKLIANYELQITAIAGSMSEILNDQSLSPNELLTKIIVQHDKLEVLQRRISMLIKNLSELLTALSSSFNVDPQTTTQWKNAMSSLASLNHDVATLLKKSAQSLAEARNISANDDATKARLMREYLKANYPFKIDTISSLLNMVSTLNGDRATRAGSVVIVDNNTPNRSIPADLAPALHEIISEPVLNAIKYTDPTLAQTNDGIVVIKSYFDQNDLVITIKDNGPGITSVESALAGERLLPQSAYGQGGGLKEIQDIINRPELKKYNIRLSLITTPGKGSKIEIRISREHFQNTSTTQVATWNEVRASVAEAGKFTGVELDTFNLETPIQSNAELETMLIGEEALDQYGDLVDATQDKILYFFNDISSLLSSGRNPVEILERIEELIKEMTRFQEAALYSARTLTSIEEAMYQDGSIPEAVHKKWQLQFKSARSLIHDFNNILTVYSGYFSLAKTLSPETAVYDLRKRLGSLESLKLSFKFIQKLYESSTLRGNQIAVTFEDIDNIPDVKIPETLKFPIFRIVNELVYNSLKYADPYRLESRTAFVKIRFIKDGDEVVIIVEDNGVGIKDIESAKGGTREHPELAAGQGIGLGGIYDLARQHGFSLSHIRIASGGTRAELRIKESALVGGNSGTVPVIPTEFRADIDETRLPTRQRTRGRVRTRQSKPETSSSVVRTTGTTVINTTTTGISTPVSPATTVGPKAK